MRVVTAIHRISSGLLRIAVPAIILLATAENVVGQTTVKIGASKDNTLYESADGSLSNGAGEHFFVGQTSQMAPATGTRRGLIAFDVGSAVPAGATITSVSLTLNMSKTSFASPEKIELHRALSNWGEATSNAAANEGSGAASTTGDATWIHTFYNTAQWKKAGGDLSSTVSASFPVGSIGSYTWASTSQLVADVQSWLATPATNFGWVITGVETVLTTAKRFDSRENPVAAVRPSLSITYATTTAVRREASLPTEFSLLQNYPNPFNPSTEIQFTVADPRYVTLEIYDLIGRRVAILVDEDLNPGTYSVRWEASSYPSGVYFCRLAVSDHQQGLVSLSLMRRIVLLK